MTAESVAPKSPGMVKQDISLSEKPIELTDLPAIEDFPKEWHVFILHLVYAQIGIKMTLPQAWEQIFGKTERYVATSKMKLVDLDGEQPKAFICDIFPPETADSFRKWLNAQIFLDRPKKRYMELFTEEFYPVEGKALLPNVVSVAGLSTCGGIVVTDKPLTFPVSFKLMQPDPGIAQRAKFAMEQPEMLVSGLEMKEQDRRKAMLEKRKNEVQS